MTTPTQPLRDGAQAIQLPTNFSTLKDTIEDAFRNEWEHATHMPAPAADMYRDILFAAIARGVLKYLEANKSNLETYRYSDTTGIHTYHLEFTVDQ